MCGCGCDRCRTATAYGFAVPHGGAVTSAPLRVHPASYNGGVQPTGSDRTTPIQAVDGQFARGTMVENPQMNQAEAGTPHASAYGRGLRALVASGHIVRDSAPVMPPTTGGFRGFFGYVKARAATSVIVPRGTYYTGQLPLSEQPKVDKPRPWADVFGLGAKYSG